MTPKLALGPGPLRSWFRDLLEPTGCEPVEDPAEADGLVWLAPHDADALADTLAQGPQIRWVQLPAAGVEYLVDAGVFDRLAGDPDHPRLWTAAKAIYGEPVAEHALALLLAGLRDLDQRVGATSWGEQSGRTLYDARVVILGAGGIAEALARLLAPFRVKATVVRRQAQPGAGGAGDDWLGRPPVERVVGADGLLDAVADADAVVVALALTPQTTNIVDEAVLRAMKDTAWLVNVGRGKHVDTDALLTALHEHWIGGAALDVTEPEPLPDGHPLWSAPRCIITPHSANTVAMAWPHLSARIAENARRFAAGEPLLGQVDPHAGY